MKNNFGFMKYEVLTVMVLILALSSFLLYFIFKGNNSKKFDALMNDAIKFSNVVTTNISSFHNSNVVYLGEVMDEKLMSEIRSPFSSRYCDYGESKVELINGTPYVTLKCDSYLIKKEKFNDKSDVKVHKVGEWNLKQTSSKDEAETLYNCVVDGKELFDEYYEELYFVFRINAKFGTEYYFADNIENECKVKAKTFYRTTEIFE